MKERMKERIGALALLLLLQTSRCRHISALSEVDVFRPRHLPASPKTLSICSLAELQHERRTRQCVGYVCVSCKHMNYASTVQRLLGLLLVKSMKRSDWSCCSVFRSLSYSERPSWCFCRLCDLSSQTHIDISIKGDYGTLAKGDLSTVV